MNEHEIRKQIVFNISQHDHELIKKEAKKRGMNMRTWIIYAMANEIKRNQEEIK
jgi:predicted DNA binding CopG/RHH family protein